MDKQRASDVAYALNRKMEEKPFFKGLEARPYYSPNSRSTSDWDIIIIG